MQGVTFTAAVHLFRLHKRTGFGSCISPHVTIFHVVTADKAHFLPLDDIDTPPM